MARRRTLRVLVVDGDPEVRKEMVRCYLTSIRPSLSRTYDDTQISNASGVPEAQAKIIEGFYPHIIILSASLNKTDGETFSDWLSRQQLSIPFVVLNVEKK